MNRLQVGYAVCGSFCTLKKSLEQMKKLSEKVDITPIVSPIVQITDSRFGKASDFIDSIREISGREPIMTVAQAEPIGPKALLDIVIVAPCTGNTLAKLALGVTDTSVTMAAKAHLRNRRPLLLAPATNDALSASAKNIGLLMNTRNIYFVPMSQDDPLDKPTSVIADFDRLEEAMYAALEGKQLQPMLF